MIQVPPVYEPLIPIGISDRWFSKVERLDCMNPMALLLQMSHRYCLEVPV